MSKARDLAGLFNLNPTSGTTAQRPATADVGEIYYNGTTGKTQIYTPTGWQDMASGIPYGNTAGRPTAVTGQPYFNGETQRLELYTGTSWENIVQEVPGVSSISGNYSEATNSGVITIYGTNFVNGAYATAIGANGVQINAASTTYNSLVQLTATFTGLSNAQEPYDIKVTNPSNLFGLIPDALYVNASPVWTTASGSLGTFDEQVSITLSALSATDSDSTITYALASGSTLPSGVTLNSSTGVISGTLPNISSSITYNFTINASDGVNTIPRSFSISSTAFVAAEVLVVAGGGGSGGSPRDAWYPGGGGAGGYRYMSSTSFLVGQSYSLSVGNGGLAGVGGTGTTSTRGQNGSNSSLQHRSGSIISTGGGGGGAGHAASGQQAGSGGSGGGGASTQTAGVNTGGSGNSGGFTPVEGYSGGTGDNGGTGYSASGGGSSGPGINSGTQSVSGGAGTSNSITGSAITYASGGGITRNTLTPAAGAANTGNGAFGGTIDTAGSPTNGSNGGSGVVVISYPDTLPAPANISVGLTYDQPARSGYRVYRFTAGSGTVTF